jgi:NAD(P)-dependent dehydrogenase (short-subunit alcohol dehydrogenase family)
MERMKGKAILVTGAGSGIGQASAELFADEGRRIVVAGIRARGGDAIAVIGDVSVAADATRMVEETVHAFGRIEVLHSNAGIPSVVESIEILPEVGWDRVIDVNLKGTYLLSRAAIPRMKAQGGDVILMPGSEMGFLADPQAPVYNASKGGLHMLMKSMVVNLIKHNIRVNAVCPGITNTPPLQREIDTSPDPAKTHVECDARAPIGRMGTPREMAQAALFLVSDESAFDVGATILVDGGYTAT